MATKRGSGASSGPRPGCRPSTTSAGLRGNPGCLRTPRSTGRLSRCPRSRKRRQNPPGERPAAGCANSERRHRRRGRAGPARRPPAPPKPIRTPSEARPRARCRPACWPRTRQPTPTKNSAAPRSAAPPAPHRWRGKKCWPRPWARNTAARPNRSGCKAPPRPAA